MSAARLGRLLALSSKCCLVGVIHGIGSDQWPGGRSDYHGGAYDVESRKAEEDREHDDCHPHRGSFWCWTLSVAINQAENPIGFWRTLVKRRLRSHIDCSLR